MIWRLAAGMARLLPPEAAHRAAVATLARKIGPAPQLADMPVTLAGLTFRNPLGLAAGFDKDAGCPDGALRLGFGHVELGTITPYPQPGNPRPRVFPTATVPPSTATGSTAAAWTLPRRGSPPVKGAPTGIAG